MISFEHIMNHCISNLTTKEAGVLGENIARKYLIDRGYKIHSVNYKVPWAEIDIIGEKKGVIVFFEVKANMALYRQKDFAPEIRVNRKKRQKIEKLARHYINKNVNKQRGWQLDILAIVIDKKRGRARVRHFRNV